MHLAVENLCLERGGRHVAGPLSFGLRDGEALVVLGPNGSGKTTLLKALAGLLRPARGSISLANGHDLGIAEHCHYLAHENAVKARLTLRENAAFWAAYLGAPQQRAEAALDRLGLGLLPDFPAAYLSAGQRRRLALSRLLVARRPVWLLDEPTASLDETAAAAFGAIVDDHLRSGGLAVVATHVPLALSSTRELRLGAGSGST